MQKDMQKEIPKAIQTDPDRSRLEAEVAIEKGILTREGGDNGRWIISAELTEKL